MDRYPQVLPLSPFDHESKSSMNPTKRLFIDILNSLAYFGLSKKNTNDSLVPQFSVPRILLVSSAEHTLCMCVELTASGIK